MLIITTNILASGLDTGTALSWAGPKILAVLPGSGLTQTRIRRLEDDFIIVEFLHPPRGAPEILAVLARRLGGRFRDADGPLLYLDRPFAAAEVKKHLEAMGADPHDLAWEIADGGRLAMLRAGEMIATSPLLPEALRMLGERAIDDALFVELLRDTFAWSPQ